MLIPDLYPTLFFQFVELGSGAPSEAGVEGWEDNEKFIFFLLGGEISARQDMLMMAHYAK